MYRYYEKKEYDVMEYEFDSISDFLQYLDNTPTSSAFMYSNLSSKTSGYHFCKTSSFQEAEELCRYGYHEDFDKLLELKSTLEKYIKMSRAKNRQYNYYVGYAPNVKAYLEGSPLSMFMRETPQRKHVDIYYNSAILGNVSTEQIFNRGAITLSIVEILENLGFGVGLHVFTMSQCCRQIHFAKFNLKQCGERLNIQKLYFPLCHPSFLRRLVFRLREETPDITDEWTDGYGRTCDDYTIRDIIDLKDNNIVICQPSEMGVRGYDIVDDANAMFNYINQFTSDDIKLEHVKKLEKTRKI